MKAQRAFAGINGSHEGWAESSVYWDSMSQSGFPKK